MSECISSENVMMIVVVVVMMMLARIISDLQKLFSCTLPPLCKKAHLHLTVSCALGMAQDEASECWRLVSAVMWLGSLSAQYICCIMIMNGDDEDVDDDDDDDDEG